jgi:hypothetical protein
LRLHNDYEFGRVKKVIREGKKMTALRNKTFRASEDVFEALKNKANELNMSESDIVTKALKCFLGLTIDNDCATYQIELETLKSRLEKLIKANNLKEV